MLLLAVAVVHVVPAAPVPKASAKVVVEKYLDAADIGKGDTDILHTAPMVDVIHELAKHFDDEPEARRLRAIGVAGSLGYHSTDPAVRRATTTVLLDQASGANGGKKRNAGYAIDSLVPYRKSDFGPTAAEAVAKLVAEPDPSNTAILLAGLLDVTAATDRLRKLSEPVAGRSPFLNPQWSANLALARLGDAAAAKHCLASIEGEQDIVQRARHLGWLPYLHSKEAMKVLVGYLNSDDRLPDVKPGIEGQRVALTAITQMAGTVEGFPVKRDLSNVYTAEQLTTARTWVKEQKELKWKE